MQEVITIHLDPKTLKGIAIGGLFVFSFLLIVYRISTTITRDRIRNRMYDSYHGRGGYPPPPPSSTSSGFPTVFFLLAGTALMAMYLKATERPVESQPVTTELGEEETYEDESAVESHLYSPEVESPVTYDEAIRFVADTADGLENGTTSPHFVQVAATDDLEKTYAAIAEYQQAYPGHTVSIAMDTKGAYPVKILIGPFNSEAQARRAAKTRQPYKNVIADGLELLTVFDRIIY